MGSGLLIRPQRNSTLTHEPESFLIFITFPSGPCRKPGRPSKAARRGKRGKVKELILAGFKEAGEAGIAVKHLAAKLAIKPQNIHVWLHTTGKKNGLTEALGKGVYRLKESIGAETDQKFLEAPKPKTVKTARKPHAKKKA